MVRAIVKKGKKIFRIILYSLPELLLKSNRKGNHPTAPGSHSYLKMSGYSDDIQENRRYH